MKSVVEPEIVRLVQLLAFTVSGICQSRVRGGRGAPVNLIKVAPATGGVGRVVCLRADATTRPDVSHTALAAAIFAQQDGSAGILDHRGRITLGPPIGQTARGIPVNADAMTIRLGQI